MGTKKRLDAGRTRPEYNLWMLRNNLGIARSDVTLCENNVKAELARTGQASARSEKALEKARATLKAVEAALIEAEKV